MAWCVVLGAASRGFVGTGASCRSNLALAFVDLVPNESMPFLERQVGDAVALIISLGDGEALRVWQS